MGKKLSLFLVGLFLAGCAPERLVVQDRAQIPPSQIAVPTPQPTAVSPLELPTPSQIALFFVPHQQGDLAGLIKVLKESPAIRPTLIFPAHYFDEMGRKTLIPDLKTLIEENKIEIGMNLTQEPVLPLLGDLSLAAPRNFDWNFQFKWPEDIAAHLAKGRMEYLKRWGRIPSGFLPPFSAISLDVVKNLQLFKLKWTLASPQTAWGYQIFDGLVVLAPPKVDWNPVPEEIIRKNVQNYCKGILVNPIAFVDANVWPEADTEVLFFEELAQSLENIKPRREGLLASELCDSINNLPFPYQSDNIFQYDYSPWVRTDRHRLGWKALAQARKVVDNYKNSGQANLKKLDPAMEEIYQAENGDFLKSLGDPKQRSPEEENAFLATLGNVYRLSDTQIPVNFNQWFSLAERRTAFSNAEDFTQPFFIAGDDDLTWNDPPGDDFGDGNYTYPMGSYPKGAFDLKTFYVSWENEDVVFSITLLELISGQDSAVMPLMDVYIDVNRLPGAGSTDPLPNRQNCSVAWEAAWEYALSFNLVKGELYQPIPGQSPRKVFSVDPIVNTETKTISIRFPYGVLRGQPERWRFTVGLMGTEVGSPTGELKPIMAGVNAKQKGFGGSLAGRRPPPFIDILSPTPEDQVGVLSAYRTGAIVTLPFVEAE